MSSYMTSMARYSTNCPFLHRTSTATLRTLAATPSSLAPNVSNLASKAVDACPIMGPTVARKIQVRGMASVAGPKDLQQMHKVSRSSGLGSRGRSNRTSCVWLRARATIPILFSTIDHDPTRTPHPHPIMTTHANPPCPPFVEQGHPLHPPYLG